MVACTRLQVAHGCMHMVAGFRARCLKGRLHRVVGFRVNCFRVGFLVCQVTGHRVQCSAVQVQMQVGLWFVVGVVEFHAGGGAGGTWRIRGVREQMSSGVW